MRQNAMNGSRRSFLKFSAAAAAGAAVFGRLPAMADHHDEYGGLPIGLQSYTLRSMSIEKALETMHETLKVSNVEIFPGHHPGKSPQQVKELLDKHQIKATGYGVVPFKKDEAANRKFFEVAKALGAKMLSCDPDPDSFDTLDKLVEEYQISAAIHPHGPGHRWAKIKTMWDAVKDHHKLIGICADTGHLIRAEQDPMEAMQAFKGRLYGVHWKDFKHHGGDNWEDVPAGDASLKVEPLIAYLIEQKFNGSFSIEFEGDHPVEATQKTLDRIRSAVAKAKKTA